MYLNENVFRDLFVFLVEAMPKEKMDDLGEDVGGGGSSVAAAIRRKCVEAVAAALQGGGESSLLPYEDFETIRLKIPRYNRGGGGGGGGFEDYDDHVRTKKEAHPKTTKFIREYENEIIPWVWDQANARSVLMASLLEANTRAIIDEGKGGRALDVSEVISAKPEVNYDVGDMLKKAITTAKSSLANEVLSSSSSSSSSRPHALTFHAEESKPVKPVKPSKRSKPKLDREKETDAAADQASEEAAAAPASVEGVESAEEKASKEREVASKALEEEVELTRVLLGKMKEEILSLQESKVEKEEAIADLARQKTQVGYMDYGNLGCIRFWDPIEV